MEDKQINEAAAALLQFYEEGFSHPFPYEDCRLLQRKEDHQDLIPDLDAYFYNIASHCLGIKKVLNWPIARLEASRKELSQSFFDKHPQYERLKQDITDVYTPNLYARLRVCERLRADLTHLISKLLSRQSLEA
jgi:hypothetical protein